MLFADNWVIMCKKTASNSAISAVISLTLQSESNRHRFMLRLLLALIFSVLGLFQSDAMSSVVTPPIVPKSGLHSVSDKALTTSFTPVAKVTDGERYTIVHDYLGTPTQAYDSEGNLVWEMLLDVSGGGMESRGDRSLVPFRYQGQYEDSETGLYYNRFRYYSPQMGMYISSDPIGLARNTPTLYGYAGDINTWIDVWGLDPYGPNQDVYALYKMSNVTDGAPNAGAKPYYVGISYNSNISLSQHIGTGRFNENNDVKVTLHEQIDYATARGYEQYYIENMIR